MDFRTCPACQASVLEDDVADCPFCGASMSGKPGPKPKPAAPKLAKKPAAKSDTDKPAGAPTSKPKPKSSPQAPVTKGAPGEDDDPFEVETGTHTKAIPLSPKATKSRTFLVKCPMCETEGYIKPEDTGKHVRCGNANCMIPVFKVPRVAIEEKPTAASREGLSPAIKWGGGAVLVGVVGAAIWFFVLRDQNDGTVPPVNIPITPSNNNNSDPNSNGPKPPVTPVVKKVTLAEIHAQILAGVKELSQQRRPNNRSIEYSRQLATEILVIGGKQAAANDELAGLKRISDHKSPYHQLDPLVEFGWQEIAAGNTTEAAARVTAAAAILKEGVPSAVRRTLDSEIRLLALQTALNQGDLVLPQLEKHGTEPRARLSLLWLCAVEGKGFDFAQEVDRVWHAESPAPVPMAVIETLVCRGYPAQARGLIGQLNDVVTQEACLAAWAGRLALLHGPNSTPLTSELANANLSPTAQIRMLCAVADAQLARGDRPGGVARLAEAVALAEALPASQPATRPSMKAIYDSNGQQYAGLQHPVRAHAHVLALADIALLQLRLSETDSSWTTLQAALDWARAMAPSPSSMQELLDDCDTKSVTVKNQLDTLLKLEGNSASIFRAFNLYRRQCDHLMRFARERFDLQTRLLKIFVLRGQLQPVWAYIQEREGRTHLNEHEAYYDTTLPGLLQIAGSVHDKALEQQLIALNQEHKLSYDLLGYLQLVLPNLTADVKNLTAAAQKLRDSIDQDQVKKQPFLMDEITLQAFAIVQRKATTTQMLDFLLLTSDPTRMEDAFLLLGGYLGRLERGQELMRAMADENSKLEITHRLAIERGLIAVPATTTPTSAAPAE